MTLPAQDIAERLREYRQAFGVHYEPREVEVCIEAADIISRLTAEAIEIGHKWAEGEETEMERERRRKMTQATEPVTSDFNPEDLGL